MWMGRMCATPRHRPHSPEEIPKTASRLRSDASRPIKGQFNLRAFGFFAGERRRHVYTKNVLDADAMALALLLSVLGIDTLVMYSAPPIHISHRLSAT
jgi:hypothetical protein